MCDVKLQMEYGADSLVIVYTPLQEVCIMMPTEGNSEFHISHKTKLSVISFKTHCCPITHNLLVSYHQDCELLITHDLVL